jgi:uncharacterized protein (TIGR01777 family)
VFWDPNSGDLDLAGLEGVEVVFHLAGAGVGDHRWTNEYKAIIRDSRVLGTATISSAAGAMSQPPSVLVCASAIGYYGDRGSEVLTEDSEKGTGFLSDVVADWEVAADPARHAGIRVVNARTGLVVSTDGGAWQRMIRIFKLGVGGRLGSGHQYWSFISIADEVRALRYLADTPSLEGPVNLTAPNPVTNAQATTALGTALHRPTFIPAPAFALRAVLGEFSIEVLGSSRVLPARLLDSGFTFTAPTMQEALNEAL